MITERYEKFNMLESLMEMQTIKDTHDRIVFHKMCQTGALEFYDYGRGFLHIEIKAYYCPCNKKYACRIWFATIDDGDFGGWKYFNKFKDAKKTAIKIKDVFKDIIVLPNKEKLNTLLRHTGMCVDYE